MALSKTQIDKLGDRLRSGHIADADIELLEEYRRSFGAAYDLVIDTIEKRLGLQASGRRAKTTPAISEKLLRESIRLSQIQDIAGCRLVVPDIVAQDQTVSSLSEMFPEKSIVDRREAPSHGYRAVHVVV